MNFDLNTIWFLLVGVLLTGYALLDGFDLGVGALHLLVKKDEHRRLLLNAIGPVWDGNEVWLVTGGGALFAAFPEAYATVFSGFYVAFFLFLAMLIFRAVSIDFRSKLPAAWWRSLWDVNFALGSVGAGFLIGVAMGNIVWGVPLDEQGELAGRQVLPARTQRDAAANVRDAAYASGAIDPDTGEPYTPERIAALEVAAAEAQQTLVDAEGQLVVAEQGRTSAVAAADQSVADAQAQFDRAGDLRLLEDAPLPHLRRGAEVLDQRLGAPGRRRGRIDRPAGCRGGDVGRLHGAPAAHRRRAEQHRRHPAALRRPGRPG